MTTNSTAPPQPVARLVDGTELLGEYCSPGVQVTQHLVRRPDGQMLQLTPLLYAVAACLDSGHDLETVAARVSTAVGRDVSADNVAHLIDSKLRPSGLVVNDDETAPAPRANPLLALKLRVGLVPEPLHRAVTTALRPLFRPAVVVTALTALVAVDAWLIVNGATVVQAGREVLYRPQLLLIITALTIASGVFHETGHATAARYGGATPGVMGGGIYLIWPVFYTDVTDSYRLDRRGRLRTDLGGVYFNVLFTLATAVAFFATGFSPLLLFVVVGQVETLQQFLPFVRLDGYYVVSDLVGVPNLFAYMGPVLVRIWRRGDDDVRRAAATKLDALKPWARRLITGWVLLTAPILLINVVLLLAIAPTVAGTAWASIQQQAHDAVLAYGHHDVIGTLNNALGLGLLLAPGIGMAYVGILAAARLGRAVARWRHRRPVVATAGAFVVTAAMVVQLGLVWPQTFQSALHRAEVDQQAPQSVAPATPAPAAPVPPAAGSSPPAVVPVVPASPSAAPEAPPAASPAAAPPPMPPATCDARPPDAITAQHPDRRPWLEQVLCEAATA
jgi:putative peptide zinc metalloprotease protein